jgi:dCMP deaminase
MERISREQMLIEVAQVVARRGTCSRAQVGVVFAREGRILATGYNGAPPGIDHCVHESIYIPDQWEIDRGATYEVPQWLATADIGYRNQGHGDFIQLGRHYFTDGASITIKNGPNQTAPGCTVVEHSERNAIAYAAREGIRLGGSDAFCTHAPCLDCARALLSTGIASLTFLTPYRITKGVELLVSKGIRVIDLGNPV